MTSQSGHSSETDSTRGTPPVLDQTKLNSLQSLLGPEKTAVALEKFRKDLETNITSISEDTTPPDQKGMLAHKLVGTAGAFGLDELSHESRRFEEAVKEGAGDLDRYLDQLMSAAERAKAELSGIE